MPVSDPMVLCLQKTLAHCAHGEDKFCQGHTGISNPNTVTPSSGTGPDTHRHAQTTHSHHLLVFLRL